MARKRKLVLGYARWATFLDAADIDTQTTQLLDAGAKRVFSDVKSNGNVQMPREGFDEMMTFAQESGARVTILVTALDRLGRSLPELLHCVQWVRGLDFDLKVIGSEIDSSTMEGRAICDVLASLPEIDRKLTNEINHLRWSAARSGQAGRKVLMTPEMDDEAVQRLRAGETVTNVAKALGISRSLLYVNIRERLSPMINAPPAGSGA